MMSSKNGSKVVVELWNCTGMFPKHTLPAKVDSRSKNNIPVQFHCSPKSLDPFIFLMTPFNIPVPNHTGLSNWIPSSRCAVFRFSVFLLIFGFFQRFGRSALSFFCRFFLEVSVFFSVFFRIFSDFFSDYFQIFLARFFGQIFLKSTKLKFRFWGSGDVIEFATEILVWCSAD